MVIRLFETSRMFYLPEGLCRADTEGGPIVFYLWIIWLRKGILDFQFVTGKSPFWNIQNVLSPGGTLRRAEPEGGPIVFTFDFIGVGNGTGGFKIRIFHRPFWNVAYVLSPGGTLRSRARRWSNCFYFPFYWSRKGYWGFQILSW